MTTSMLSSVATGFPPCLGKVGYKLEPQPGLEGVIYECLTANNDTHLSSQNDIQVASKETLHSVHKYGFSGDEKCI